MSKRVILTLEFDMGDYADLEAEGREMSTNPQDYEESLIQADVFPHELKIIGVRIVEE